MYIQGELKKSGHPITFVIFSRPFGQNVQNLQHVLQILAKCMASFTSCLKISSISVRRWQSYVRFCDHTHQFALNMRNFFLGSTNFCEHPLSHFTIGCLQTASPLETKRWPSADSLVALLGCLRFRSFLGCATSRASP